MIAIGSDHGGYKLKEEIKKYLSEIGIEYKDFGTDSEQTIQYMQKRLLNQSKIKNVIKEYYYVNQAVE